jgi:hypothetical protein
MIVCEWVCVYMRAYVCACVFVNVCMRVCMSECMCVYVCQRVKAVRNVCECVIIFHFCFATSSRWPCYSNCQIDVPRLFWIERSFEVNFTNILPTIFVLVDLHCPYRFSRGEQIFDLRAVWKFLWTIGPFFRIKKELNMTLLNEK